MQRRALAPLLAATVLTVGAVACGDGDTGAEPMDDDMTEEPMDDMDDEEEDM